jgi:hypothetical protein
MSLSNVSTELDATIARLLVGYSAALAALCRTSKYYHAIANPLLYEVIEIMDNREQRIKQLLMTLLDSPQKAKNIKSFAIGKSIYAQLGRANTERIGQDLGRYGPQIGNLVEGVGLGCQVMAQAWISKVCVPGFDKNRSRESETVDATSALVLSMAHNVEQVVLMDPVFHFLSYTKKVLASQSHPKNRLLSCQKLKSMEYNMMMRKGSCRQSELLFQTCAQRLVVSGCAIKFSDHNLPPPMALRSLKLRFCGIDCGALLKMFSTSLNRLTHLALEGIRGHDTSWERGDFARLSDALEKHLPNLEDLAWIEVDAPWGDDAICFRSFRALSRLKALKVDFNAMIAEGGQSTCIDYKAIFPDSLVKLEVTDIEGKKLEMLCRHKDGDDQRNDYGRNEMAFEAWQFMTAFTGSTALQSVVIHVTWCDFLPNRQLSETTLCQLRTAADQAAARGVSFRVIVYRGRRKVDEGTLFIDNVPTTHDSQ